MFFIWQEVAILGESSSNKSQITEKLLREDNVCVSRLGMFLIAEIWRHFTQTYFGLQTTEEHKEDRPTEKAHLCLQLKTKLKV